MVLMTRGMKRCLEVVALSVAVAAFPCTPAAATVFCEILPTRDGFVALRAGPAASAKLLLRLKAGEDVQLDTTRKARGGFEPVIYRGEDRAQQVEGWVARRLISKECG